MAVALTLGFTTGAGMLMVPIFGPADGVTWHTHTQAHGVGQALGWAGLFVMGVAYHVVPRFRNFGMPVVWPQYLSLALILVGVTLRYLGQSFHTLAVSDWIMGTSAVLLVLGAVLFVALTGWTLLQTRATHNRIELWILAALGWLLVAVFIHVWIVWEMASRGSPVASSRLGEAFAHAALAGFVTLFVLGVSLRTLTNFLRLRKPFALWSWVSFASLNIGILVYLVGKLANLPDAWMVLASLLAFLGVVVFILALRLFEPSGKRGPNVARIYVRHEWFVRAAYGWLALWSLLEITRAAGNLFDTEMFEATVASPSLHVLGIGFITMMIIGMACRMLPMFEGAFLPHHRLLDIVFVLLNVSVSLRLVFGLVHISTSNAALGTSGVIGLISIVLFAWVVRGVFRPSAREAYRTEMRKMSYARIELVPRNRS
ncbi:MAG: NnrS family protein [Arenicellales bacterium]|nr:NnrS family protein [Arenicellales bacterium]